MLLINDKRYDIVFQTLFKKNQPSDSAVTVLKRMDFFKLYMKI